MSLLILISTLFLMLFSTHGNALENSEFYVPYKVISKGPAFHWFGYYDKFQTSSDDRYILTMKVEFDQRSPNENDELEVGMFDSKDHYKYIKIGTTKAWCWQQGCQLQWRPQSKTEVMWNDRVDGKFITKVYDINTKQEKQLPEPIYHLSPDGMWALGIDFARLNHMRRGYGYAGVPDKNKDQLAPKNSYLYKMNLESGDVINLTTVSEIASSIKVKDAKHYFNHPIWNTDGSRFLFVHRWKVNGGRFRTRKLSLGQDGKDLRIVTDILSASHHAWRDRNHLLVFIDGAYRLIRDDGLQKKEVLWEATNGHQTYLKDKNWVITDTYPDKNNLQHVYLRNLKTNKNISVAKIYLPPKYKSKEWRIDTHPRLTRDQTKVIIDAWIDEEQGRQQIVLDISSLISRR